MRFSMRSMVVAVAALACTAGLGPGKASALDIAGDIGVASQYVWRAVAQTGGATAVQGDLSTGVGGLTGTVWYSNAYPATRGQVVEFDWVLDYSGSAGSVGYSGGAIYYTYMNDGHSNFTEIYLGGSLDTILAPTLTVYYTVTDVDSAFYVNGDTWIDLGVSGSAGGFDLSGTLSFVAWASDSARTGDLYQDGLTAIALGASKDVDLGGHTVTPSLMYTFPVVSTSADDNQYIYGTMVNPEFIASLNVPY